MESCQCGATFQARGKVETFRVGLPVVGSGSIGDCMRGLHLYLFSFLAKDNKVAGLGLPLSEFRG